MKVEQAGTYKIVALYGNNTNTFTFDINHQPASECKFPVATGSMHKWNKAIKATTLRILNLNQRNVSNFLSLTTHLP